MKLQHKIIIPVAIIIFLSISTLGVTSYLNAKDVVLDQLHLQTQKQLETIEGMLSVENFDIQELIEHTHIGKEGYAYIIDKNGDTLNHPNRENLGNNISEYNWAQYIMEKGTGEKTYKFQGVEKYVDFKTVGDAIIVVGVPTKEFLRPLDILRRNMIIVLGLSLLISILVTYISLKKRAIKPINNLLVLMEEAGSGKLNVKAHIKSKDQIGALYTNFNKMVENISKLVKNTKDMTENLQETSEVISSTTEEVTVSSEEVARSIQEVASGVTNQSEDTHRSLKKTNQLAKNIDNMIDRLYNVTTNTTDAKNNNKLGVQAIEELENKLSRNTEASKLAADGMDELEIKSKSIGLIVETIGSISEQTNLLALNAAIEAASAGEAGKGFAVVAEEIRKLAEETSQSTKEIQNIVKEINDVVGITGKSMDDAESTVKEANVSLIETKEVFDKMNVSIENVASEIELFSSDIETVDSVKTDVLNAINNISSVSQQTSASAQEISASTEEQTAAMEEIAASIQDLNNMINKLHRSVEVFQL